MTIIAVKPTHEEDMMEEEVFVLLLHQIISHE